MVLKTISTRILLLAQQTLRKKFHITDWLSKAFLEKTNLTKTMFFKCDHDIKFKHLTTDKRVADDKARGMNLLDKEVFKCNIHVLGVLVDSQHVSEFRKKFKRQLLRVPNVKGVLENDSSNDLNKKIVLIDPSHFENLQRFQDFFLQSLFNIQQNCFCQVDIELHYNNWNYDEILSQILPEGESVGGFSVVGHIAHLNIRDSLLPHKHIIGEVIKDKVSVVTMVVNKAEMIENTFRNFRMEVLAGSGSFVSTVKEHGVTFKFDFSQVYWNPRLATEHQRVTGLLRSDDVVFDVFCGVGPFVLPAARKGCRVEANDLNPHSVHWLRENLSLNKVKRQPQVHCMEGRTFIRHVVAACVRQQDCCGKRCHVIMNLPTAAVTFLDAFVGLCASQGAEETPQQSALSSPITTTPSSTTHSSTTPSSTTHPSTTPPSITTQSSSTTHTSVTPLSSTTTTYNTLPHSTTTNTTPPLPTTTPPSSTTQPPSSTTQPPSSTTQPPSSTTQPPSSTTQPPSFTTQPSSSTTPRPLPTILVHCYTFSKHQSPEQDALRQVREALDGYLHADKKTDNQTNVQTDKKTDNQTEKKVDIQTEIRTDKKTDIQTEMMTDKPPENRTDIHTDMQRDKNKNMQTDNQTDKHTDMQVHRVRHVAPGKYMLCVSFSLPHCLLLARPSGGSGSGGEDGGGTQAKKAKLE